MAKKTTKKRKYKDVPGTPVKSFFVEMLTRDIDLADAILDLLDNCVDGILRKKGGRPSGRTPYNGFCAEIRFDKDSFLIHDNCGGIPWSLHEYAFRMGCPKPEIDRDLWMVGAYGIGMKRAMFKLGRHCLITTRNGQDEYEIEFSPKWFDNEKEWKIPVNPARNTMKEEGTTIYVEVLYPGVSARLGPDGKSFERELREKIATQYASIMNRGFGIKINKRPVRPKPIKLVFGESASGEPIEPFIYTTSVAGVNIFLAVGFTRPIPSEEEVQDEQQEARYSSLDAGWTVVCNDRAVLACDRSEMTGWGEAGVPKYHTQFIAISGIVEFRSQDAALLPTTTTKRGIDASSTLYLQVKNKMREGMAIFTSYTNKWKGRQLAGEARKHIEGLPTLTFGEIKERASSIRLTKVVTHLGGKQHKPVLPMPPKRKKDRRRIAFSKTAREVDIVADYVFPDKPTPPSRVGEKCFDLMLKEARK